MPFTFAHPAAILPLSPWCRRWLVFSALVVGAMAPDFGYLFPGGYVHSRTHTALSLLWFSLPAGLVVWWLFELLVKQPLISLAPRAWRPKLAPLAAAHPGVRGRGLPAVVLSVLIGAGSHLLLDAATHGSGALVRALPSLETTLLRIGGHELQAYKLLQHGLSLAGLAALAWCARRWLRRAPQIGRDEAPALPGATRAILWAALALIPVATAATALGLYLGRMSVRLAVGHAGVAAVGAVGLELLILGLVWRLMRKASRVQGLQ